MPVIVLFIIESLNLVDEENNHSNLLCETYGSSIDKFQMKYQVATLQVNKGQER